MCEKSCKEDNLHLKAVEIASTLPNESVSELLQSADKILAYISTPITEEKERQIRTEFVFEKLKRI